MNTKIFDGISFANQKLSRLASEVKKNAWQLTIAAIVFDEDQGSVLYTSKKQAAAAQVGIGYQVHHFSLQDSTQQVIELIRRLNQEPQITGLIIQKPWRHTWQQVTGQPATSFSDWWQVLTQEIAPAKDVDCLSPTLVAKIKICQLLNLDNKLNTTSVLLPATCQAVVDIAQAELGENWWKQRIVMIGKSDLLGRPLFYLLQNLQQKYLTGATKSHFNRCEIKLFGKSDFNAAIEHKKFLLDFDLVVTATGIKHLISGAMVKPGAAVVDAGEPNPDVEQASMIGKVAFLTPVPGGVGPVTVACLLENAIKLVQLQGVL